MNLPANRLAADEPTPAERPCGAGSARPLRKGFIIKGRAGGTLTLADDRGTITLSLTGPVQKGFAPLPGHFSFTVTSAPGAFEGSTASGVAVVRLRQTNQDETAAQGRFTIAFSKPPPGPIAWTGAGRLHPSSG